MKIVVGFDSSNTAKAALDAALKRAAVMSAAVEVITSMEAGTDGDLPAIESAKADLEAVKDIAAKTDVACDTHLLIRGQSPGEDLVGFAREHGCDEIVVGVRRRSKVGKLLMGSTAQYVILNAHCPVLTVK